MKKLSHFFSGTLRTRLIISVALVHAVMMSLFIIDLTNRQRDMLLSRQTEEAIALSQSLATSSAGWIAAADIAGLQELANAQNRYPEIIFAIIADKDGHILASTDKHRQGQYLIDLPHEARITVISSSSSLVDVAVPALVAGRHVGWTRVGIGQRVASEKLAEIVRWGVLYGFMAIVIGSIIAWFMGRQITRRLYAVHETMNAVRSGNPQARSTLVGNDEAADIAREFNSMLDIIVERGAELRSSEAIHKAFFENSMDAVILGYPDGTVFAANPAACTLFGTTEEQICILGRKALIDQTDPRLWAYVKERDETGKSQTEVTMIRVDGTKFEADLRTSMYSDSIGNKMVCVIMRDLTERKQAEEALHESEEKFSTIFHSTPVAMLLATVPEGRIHNVNDAYLLLTGYKNKEEVLGKTSQELDLVLDEETRERVQEEFRRDGIVRNTEVMFRNCAGLEKTVLLGLSPINIGGRMFLLSTNLDITERKRAEEALQKSETWFRSLFENASDGIFYLSTNDELVEVNQAFARMHGYSVEEMQKMSIKNLDTPETAQQYPERIRRILGGETFTFEVEHYHKDGHTFPLEVTASVITFGEVKYILAFHRDITERKRAEEALVESKQHWQTLVQFVPIGLYQTDNQGSCIYINEQACEITGLTFATAMGTGWSAAIHPDDRARVFAMWEQTVRDGGEFQSDYRFKTPADKVKWVHGNAIALRDTTGSVIGYLGSISDITDRKQAEEDIIKLNTELELRVAQRTAQLEAANKELEAFSYSVSHDLRAPLRHVNGYVDLFNKHFSGSLPEKGKYYLNTIADSARQMGTLIDDLLQFSRTGRSEMVESNVDMNEMVQEVLKSLQQEYSDRTIEWSVSSLPHILCDKAMVKLVWINLLQNAVKFTKTREHARIEIGALDENTDVVFFVRDNGVGFDMKYVQKLFGVFQRLHSHADFEGTGIGLANVRRIVLRHGGRTWAEAELNKGATFYFTMPKQKELTHD